MDISLKLSYDNGNTFRYSILNASSLTMGYIELRTEKSLSMYYYGNIGYRIYEKYRGHGYAYQACLMMVKIARNKGLKSLIITASPDNIPSIKTIEKLNPRFIEQVKVPIWHPMYYRGEKVKNIYEIVL